MSPIHSSGSHRSNGVVRNSANNSERRALYRQAPASSFLSVVETLNTELNAALSLREKALNALRAHPKTQHTGELLADAAGKLEAALEAFENISQQAGRVMLDMTELSSYFREAGMLRVELHEFLSRSIATVCEEPGSQDKVFLGNKKLQKELNNYLFCTKQATKYLNLHLQKGPCDSEHEKRIRFIVVRLNMIKTMQLSLMMVRYNLEDVVSNDARACKRFHVNIFGLKLLCGAMSKLNLQDTMSDYSLSLLFSMRPTIKTMRNGFLDYMNSCFLHDQPPPESLGKKAANTQKRRSSLSGFVLLHSRQQKTL
ncbi:MAG: hypothetical protein HC848_09760 [Limnobacter sp.]|nr:hypothetical protein [Limnobacter sp.]